MAEALNRAGFAETDVRYLVRLLGETAAVRGGYLERKTHFLDGLCRLVGAHEWRWATFLPGPPFQLTGALSRHLKSSPEASLAKEAFFGAEDWSMSAAAETGAIISRKSLAGAAVGCIALCRDGGAPPFSQRESRLVLLCLEEVTWLHSASWPKRIPGSTLKLTNRQQRVLESLLRSEGRKQIAADLGISENTVAGYIKDIYRRFSVQSHRELVKHPLLAEKKHWSRQA